VTNATEQRQRQPQNWGQIAITGTRRDCDEFGRSCSDPNFAAAPVAADLKSASAPSQPTPIVLDTNIILDLYVFKDPATFPLHAALESGTHQWIATQPMRDELERVLAYPQIVPRLAFYQLTAIDILAKFDKFARQAPIAPNLQRPRRSKIYRLSCGIPSNFAEQRQCGALYGEAAVCSQGYREHCAVNRYASTWVRLVDRRWIALLTTRKFPAKRVR
jgi:PIN domain